MMLPVGMQPVRAGEATPVPGLPPRRPQARKRSE